MRSCPKAAILATATLATATAMLSSACSSTSEDGAEPTTSISELPPLSAEPTPAGTAGISPDGVTTSVDVPAEATESQYGQACLAAKKWMDGQGGDPKTLIEPYLKVLQAPGFSDPASFNTPWAQLTPGQQSGVIMAANAAANGECG